LPFLIYGKRPKTLPSVLSPGEVLRLLEAAPPGRDRVFLQVAYGCGLRLSELLHLRVGDIDSARMVVHVRQGKGGKDRLVPLSLRLLQELRDYWLRCRPRTWLFPGQKPDGTLSAGNLQRRFVQHVLPQGFLKIRHYGLLAHAQRQARLTVCRRCLLVVTVGAALPSPDRVPTEPAQPRCCAHCGGTRLVYHDLPAGAPTPLRPAGPLNSS
jgi:integrase